MLKVSSYNIYIKTLDEDDKYLFVHGYTGAVDVVSEDIYLCLLQAEENAEKLNNLSNKTVSVLQERGYLTQRSLEEEKNLLRKVAYSIREHNRTNPVIAIIPTYNCNFRCSYCYESRLKKNGKQWMEKVMSKEKVDAVFNMIEMLEKENKSVKSIILYGGEPLLKQNYDIIEYIIKKCINAGIVIKCVTNGYDLEYYQELIGYGKIAFLQITLDGLAEIHDKRRFLSGGRPTFEIIANNIDLALKLGAAVNARTNVDESNLDQLVELLELYRRKGWMDNKLFYPYFKSVQDCRESHENLVDELYIMKRLEQFNKDRININSSYSMLAQSFMHLFINKKYAPLRGGFCGAVNGHMVIDPYGDIYPCWAIAGNRESAAGSIYYTGNRDFYINMQQPDNKMEAYIGQCSECPYALFCGGGCPVYTDNRRKDQGSYCSRFKSLFHEAVPEAYRNYKKICYNTH